jgi:hypothetical protein
MTLWFRRHSGRRKSEHSKRTSPVAGRPRRFALALLPVTAVGTATGLAAALNPSWVPSITTALAAASLMVALLKH